MVFLKKNLKSSSLTINTNIPYYGFQVWDENDNIAKGVHAASEFYDPGAGSPIDIATEYIWTIFKSKKSIPKEVIPKP